MAILQQQQEDIEMVEQPSTEGPQPMEVAPISHSFIEPPRPLLERTDPMEDNAGHVENQESDEPKASRYTWKIQNFSQLNKRRLYSDVFTVGGCKWRVIIFPNGNNVEYFSIYLNVADSATLPDGWITYSEFSFAVVNQMNSKHTMKKETHYQFSQKDSDWGFKSFMHLQELYDSSYGYLVDDTCIIEADVVVRKVVDYVSYNPRKEIGYVGLKNQGATCYMNSLLQTLYHIPHFRKAVYHMPTAENDNPTGSIPLALQRLFYKLQYRDTALCTKELTKSFGWGANDSFMQHDVQEFNRVLCTNLEHKMKGTAVEGTIQKLFEGHIMNYIECINVDFKSTQKESFYDLQLDVKGCKDVYASFDKYVEIERLEGDNKYEAAEHGLQDAKKGALFRDFPPVLQLHLKRFEYNFIRHTMDKINDRYEFPLELDLDRDNGKYLSLEADSSVRNLYTLHSVFVHSGGGYGGHYYAFIRPTLSDQWYKFDDERVTKEDSSRVLEEQFGGVEELSLINPGYNSSPLKFTRTSNAYMLVYIRVSDKDNIICDVDGKEIAEHLQIRLKKELKEKEDKKRYKAESYLYTTVMVARDEDLREQIGKFTYFDLVDHEEVTSFRIKKQMPFKRFKKELAYELGIPVHLQRFWTWAKRQNQTYRLERLLTPQEEEKTVGALNSNRADLKLFLEVSRGPGLSLVSPPEINKEDILLFFKLYNAEKEHIRYLGRLFVKSSGKPIEILTILNGMAGFAPDEEIELFEEIRFEPSVMCERLDKNASFRESQLKDGDIIYFQKRPLTESQQQVQFPEVPSFLEYVQNRLEVTFHYATKDEVVNLNIRLPEKGTVEDMLNDIKTQVELSHPNAELRLLEVFDCKIYKLYSNHETTENIKNQYSLHVQEVLEDERNLGPNDHLISVYHFKKDKDQRLQYFGQPYFLVIHDGETLADVKIRIEEKSQISFKLSEWKVAFSPIGPMIYLEDSDIISSLCKRVDKNGIWEPQYLGLERCHDTKSARTYDTIQNQHRSEKPMKILN